MLGIAKVVPKLLNITEGHSAITLVNKGVKGKIGILYTSVVCDKTKLALPGHYYHAHASHIGR